MADSKGSKQSCPLTVFYTRFPDTKSSSAWYTLEKIEEFAAAHDIEIIHLFSPRLGHMPHVVRAVGGRPARLSIGHAPTKLLAYQLALGDLLEFANIEGNGDHGKQAAH